MGNIFTPPSNPTNVPITTSTSYKNPIRQPSTCLLNPPSEDFGKDYVDYHNNLRKEIWKDIEEPNEVTLKWNSKLAENAQIWANTLAEHCTYENPSNITDGQNIFMTYTDSNKKINPDVSNHKSAINSWFNTCKSCTNDIHCSPIDAGPYSQVAWKDVKNIGCGKAKAYGCDSDKTNEILSRLGNKTAIPNITNREYIVCNYDVKPHANYIDYNIPKRKPSICPIKNQNKENYDSTCVF